MLKQFSGPRLSNHHLPMQTHSSKTLIYLFCAATPSPSAHFTLILPFVLSFILCFTYSDCHYLTSPFFGFSLEQGSWLKCSFMLPRSPSLSQRHHNSGVRPPTWEQTQVDFFRGGEPAWLWAC